MVRRPGFGPSLSTAFYARAYNGQKSRWYQAAVTTRAGRITAAAMTKDVSFVPVDDPINDLIDGAYRQKYRGSPYLQSMVGADARSPTVKITPRQAPKLR